MAVFVVCFNRHYSRAFSSSHFQQVPRWWEPQPLQYNATVFGTLLLQVAYWIYLLGPLGLPSAVILVVLAAAGVVVLFSGLLTPTVAITGFAASETAS